MFADLVFVKMMFFHNETEQILECSINENPIVISVYLLVFLCLCTGMFICTCVGMQT
jgi:hypothetical protein